jgi:methyl-accepting chemotaxis protein
MRTQLSIASRLIATASVIMLVVVSLLTALVYWRNTAAVEKVGLQELSAQARLLRGQLETLAGVLRGNAERSADMFSASLPGPVRVDREQTAQTGEHRAPVVRAGDLVLSNNPAAVDAFSRSSGGVATVFARVGDDFLRVSTSVKKEDGSRAVGTMLGKSHPAYASVIAGKPYVGPARLFGRDYMAKYVPVLADGQVVAMLFVGFDYTAEWKATTAQFSEVRIGEKGYVYLLDARTTASRGTLIVHPKHVGKKAGDEGVAPHYKTILEQREGSLQYEIPGGGRRAASFELSPSWNYIVAASLDQDELMASARDLRNLMLLLAPVALLLGAVLLLLVVRRALRPLGPLAESVARLGAGDLTVRVGHVRNDEIGRLGQGFNAMADALRALIADTATTVGSLRQSMTALEASSRRVAEGSHAQSDAAAGVAASVEELSTGVDTVAENTRDTEALCGRTRELAVEGGTVVDHAASEVGAIAQSVTSASATIRELGGRSADISRIVDVIRDIAEQTNLLALNAAIEAARAGEQGRGFAVVADEVRNLAERTSSSTQEISRMVVAIQGETGRAIDSMEQCRRQVETGVARAHAAGKALGEINGSVDDAMIKVSEIASSIREQSVATQDIARSIERIATMSDANAAAAGESKAAVAVIDQCAVRLEASVGKFRLTA